MQQYTPEEIDSAQIAMYMRSKPDAFKRLLNDPEERADSLAERVLRGLRILRRTERQPTPSESNRE